MTKTWTLLLAVAASGCTGTAQAPSAPAAAVFDDAAAAEARAAVQKGVAAFASQDLAAVKAELAQDGTVATFELDLDNKPVRLATRDEALKYAEDMFAQLGKMKATLAVDVRSLECRATATIAYCAMEHDFKASMPDGGSISQPSRATIVLRKGGDGWKWTHWHTSLAAAPAAPAPAEPAAKPAGNR